MNDHRALWRLAGPLILSNLSVALLALVDTAVVGHLPDPAFLGGTTIGATIFTFMYWGFGFLRMGTVGLAAQAEGRAEPEALRRVLGQALVLALSLGALIVLLQWPVERLALRLSGASVQVRAQADLYFSIRVWSAPAVLVGYVVLGWFIGLGNARAPLYLLLVVNGLNVALDLLFVVGFGLQVAGVALATLIAEYAGLGLGLVLVARELRRRPGRWDLRGLLEPASLRRMLAVNRHLFVRTLALLFAFAFFHVQGARQGDAVLAANAVLLNFQTLMALALDGIAHAAESLVGQAVGGGQRAPFVRAVRVATLWSALMAAGFCVGYALAGERIVAALSDLPQVREQARQYLPYVVIMPLVAVWSFLLDGVFIGATQARAMRDAMLASVAVYLLLWYLLRPLGNHGLWLAFTGLMLARGLFMGEAFRRLDRRGAFLSAGAGRQAAQGR